MEINLFNSNEHSSIYDIEGLPQGSNHKQSIELVRGDDFMRDHNIASVDFLKLDVEGAEYDIIQDIANYYPDVLFIELHMGKVKQFAQPTIDLLTELYPKNQVNSFEVFKHIGGYDCWFKK